jgi:hypothetical protein
MKRHLILLLGLLVEIGVNTKVGISEILPQYWARVGTTHPKITKKAIDLLVEKGGLKETQLKELKKYSKEIVKGSIKEDGGLFPPGWRTDNHAYDTHEQDWESIIMPQPLIGQRGPMIQETKKRMSMTGRMHEDTTKRVTRQWPISALDMYAIFFRICLFQAIPFHQ